MKKILAAAVAVVALSTALTACNGGSDDDCESLGTASDAVLASMVDSKSGGSSGGKSSGSKSGSKSSKKGSGKTSGKTSTFGKHSSHDDDDDCDDDD